MPAVMPSGYNTYVPDHDSSGRLVVNFSRNTKDFALAQYVQLVPVKKNIGLYLEMTVEEAGRVINTDLADVKWPDGQDSPMPYDALEEFQWKEYRTQRYAYAFVLGDLANEQATWEIDDQNITIQAQRAMTARSLLAANLLTTAANYDASHTSAVASISGNTGTWAASTTARQDIKRSLNTALNVIRKDTLSAVKKRDIQLVLGPEIAAVMAESQEIADYMKSSYEAGQVIRGENAWGEEFSLPARIYGFPVVIEDAVRTTNRKGATKSTSFVWPSDKAALISRPGGLVGKPGPSFSSVTCFVKEEMTVEKKHDSDHRRILGRVTDDYHMVLTAPVSAYLFTSCQ